MAARLTVTLLALSLILFLLYHWHREKTVGEERQAWARERAELLQRIQAPEIAVVDHSRGDNWQAPDPAPAMSDADLWKVLNGD